MDNEKELQQLRNRFRDLADKSFSRNMFTFTGFLGLSEQDAFWKMERELSHVKFVLSGGADSTDRKVVRFGNADELGYEVDFPIVCIHIKPLQAKFADALSHRDFLGALMNLGIERSTLGDIRVGDKEAYLFCLESIAEYICENLTQVKHTYVRCEVVEHAAEVPEEEPQRLLVQAASMRVDAVLAKVYNKSREVSLALFRAQKVFVDGRLCENNAKQLKVGETVNARGYGKFRVVGEPKETKKGRMAVEVEVFR